MVLADQSNRDKQEKRRTVGMAKGKHVELKVFVVDLLG